LAFPFIIVASAFDALAWLTTLDGLQVDTTFAKIFSLSWIGHFVDVIVPGGLAGDAFKTYLLTKEKNVNGSKAVASIVVKDILELLVILGSIILGIILLALNYTISGFVMLAIGITMALLAVPLVLILYLSMNASATERVLGTFQRVVSRFRGKHDGAASGVSEKLHRQIIEFHDGIVSMRNHPKRMILPIVCQTLTWIFELLALFIVFIAIGSPIDFDKVIITNTIVSNIQGQGVALAGISQIISSQIYTVLGIISTVSIASSLLSGFVSFWFKLVLAFGFFQAAVFEGYKITKH
jgi:uncharacterized protein (TIRG00374 family)